MIYITNAIEAVNRLQRKVINNRGDFSVDEAATKQLHLAHQNVAKRWTILARDALTVQNQFKLTTCFVDRILR